MSLSARWRFASAMLFGALAATGQAGHAQSIEISKDHFARPQALPFAPAPPPKPVPPPAPAKPTFILQGDQPIHSELQAWAKGQDWELLWYPMVSWRVLRAADLSNAADVTAAVAEVVDILRDEGKPIKLRVSEGNRVMEVVSTEVVQ